MLLGFKKMPNALRLPFSSNHNVLLPISSNHKVPPSARTLKETPGTHAELPPPPLFFQLNKRLPSERLGISFGSEGGQSGALVHRVCFDGLAWRGGLRTGDIVTRIASSTTGWRACCDGFEAARLLREEHGEVRLEVRRRKQDGGPAAAACIQAAARARIARLDVRDMQVAATMIQAAFSGFVLRVNLEALRTAATLVQRHWRGCDARLDLWQAQFAVVVLQRAARRSSRLKRANASRRRPRRIRSPATLTDVDE